MNEVLKFEAVLNRFDYTRLKSEDRVNPIYPGLFLGIHSPGGMYIVPPCIPQVWFELEVQFFVSHLVEYLQHLISFLLDAQNQYYRILFVFFSSIFFVSSVEFSLNHIKGSVSDPT